MYFHQYEPPPDRYNDKDLRNVHTVMAQAIARDSELNADEWRAKDEALKECELGPRWWLRAHP